MNNTTKKTEAIAVSNAPVTSKESIPQEKLPVKQEMDIDGFLAKRQEFIEKVNAIMVEGKDYHVIQNKKSLAKGGAEKIASIFGWTAEFIKDRDVLEAFSGQQGLIAFICNLRRQESIVGQGRGAASLGRNNQDANKTIKMAQKSAYIDAVIRSSGMSDFFTQDLEDMPQEQISKPQYTHGGEIVEKPAHKKPTPKQANLIKDLAKQKNLSQDKLIEMAKGKTPSELIDTLFQYKAYEQKEELPQMDENLQKIADETPF